MSKAKNKEENQIPNKNNLEDDDDDDEEDEDYIPENEPESDKDEKLNKRKLAKNKARNEESNEESSSSETEVKLKKDSEEPKEMSEAEKKKADELWSNFLKDTKTSTKSTGAALQSSNSNINKYSNCDNSSLSQPIKTSTTNSIKSTIFDSFNSSNDESKKILNESDNSNSETKNNSSNKSNPISKSKPSGMANLLSKLSKEPKLSTLEKSKQDWDEFKKSEKIEEDLASFAKGKNSYLERKAFLERTDLRQFEQEKEFRIKERKLREQK